MTNPIVASWINTLTPPAPKEKLVKNYTGKSTSGRYSAEQKQQLALRICNQSFSQKPPCPDSDVLDRLKDEAGMAKPVARAYLHNYKFEAGIPVDKN